MKKRVTPNSLRSGQTIYCVTDPYVGCPYIDKRQVRSKTKEDYIGKHIRALNAWLNNCRMSLRDRGIGSSHAGSRARTFYSRKKAVRYLEWLKKQPVRNRPTQTNKIDF
jgi:hypothetical protein